MIIENDPIHDLLVKLANSLIERYPDTNISFTADEYNIVNEWITCIGNAVQSQQKIPNCN